MTSQPGPSSDENREHQPGTPPGMTNDDVERRSELARFLEPGSFPCSRDELIQAATEHQAPDRVLDALRRLPEGSYENVQEIARALGWGTEERRT